MSNSQTVSLPGARAYTIVLLLVFIVLALGREIGARAVQLACWAGNPGQDAWMAYCNSDRYGVYDVEAIWHGIEPGVAAAIQAASVVTLSDSHLQNALSLGGAGDWFSTRHQSIYMLGVPTAESGFGEQLIERFQLKPKVVILDASPYFTGQFGSFEKGIFDDPRKSLDQVTALHQYEIWHQNLCTRLPWACGHNFAYFRSRQDGRWIFPSPSSAIWIGAKDVPNNDTQYPVGRKINEQTTLYPAYLEAARRLVSKLNMPHSCIVITHVPSDFQLDGLADYIGSALGLTVIEPSNKDLFTFDRAHLTPESSSRWTGVFLAGLAPVLDRCLSGGIPVTTIGKVEHPNASH